MFGWSVFNDWINRHNLNDTYLGSFYLLWTVAYYIPLFILILLILIFYLKTTFEPIKTFTYFNIIIILTYGYTCELIDFSALNFNTYLTNHTDININVLLTNMLNKYHPYIFYFCTAWTCYYVLKIHYLNEVLLEYYYFNFIYINTKLITYYIFCTNLIFLYLGAWWANQEGTWGGWWNSDSSEMLGLILAMFFLH